VNRLICRRTGFLALSLALFLWGDIGRARGEYVIPNLATLQAHLSLDSALAEKPGRELPSWEAVAADSDARCPTDDWGAVDEPSPWGWDWRWIPWSCARLQLWVRGAPAPRRLENTFPRSDLMAHPGQHPGQVRLTWRVTREAPLLRPILMKDQLLRPP
jgi:hypothetical protein